MTLKELLTWIGLGMVVVLIAVGGIAAFVRVWQDWRNGRRKGK